jgi:hypothetical protein
VPAATIAGESTRRAVFRVGSPIPKGGVADDHVGRDVEGKGIYVIRSLARPQDEVLDRRRPRLVAPPPGTFVVSRDML